MITPEKMKVKIVKCSCNINDMLFVSDTQFWYHDKIGEIFDVDIYDASVYKLDNNHYMLSDDCIDITKSYIREEKLNELGVKE